MSFNIIVINMIVPSPILLGKQHGYPSLRIYLKPARLPSFHWFVMLGYKAVLMDISQSVSKSAKCVVWNSRWADLLLHSLGWMVNVIW